MRIWLILGLAALGACGGGGPDIGGFYMVTSITTDPAGCGVGVTPNDPPTFLYASSQDFLGQAVWSVKECSAQDSTMCNNDIASFMTESIKDGWKGVLSASSGSGTTCAYTYAEQTAVVVKGVMTVEATTYTQTDTATTQDKCTTDEAKKRGTTMPCVDHTIATATLVK